MTKAQKKTLDQLRKKRELNRTAMNGHDHLLVGTGEVHIVNRDGDELMIMQNGLVVPR